MQKQRKWQLFLILAVILLTVYNIFPTLLYYSKPLRSPIHAAQGERIAAAIGARVDEMEEESKQWLFSFCKSLKINPLSIESKKNSPQQLTVHFAKEEEAARLRAFLPRSGALIPFAPARLFLASSKEEGRDVLIQRQIPIRFSENAELFRFIPKEDPSYDAIRVERAAQVAYALAGPSETARQLQLIERGSLVSLEALATQINTLHQIFSAQDHSILKRYAAQLTQDHFPERADAAESLIKAFDQMRDAMKQRNESRPELQFLEKKILTAENFLKKNRSLFTKGEKPWELSQIKSLLTSRGSLSLGERCPLFSELLIDTSKDRVLLKWHPDVLSFREKTKSPLFEQLVIDEVAKIGRLSGELLEEEAEGFSIPLTHLPNSSAFLALNLERVAALQIQQLLSALKTEWSPSHPDLRNLPIVDTAAYVQLPKEQQALCLILHTPLSSSTPTFLSGLRSQSLYVIAKGLDHLLQPYEAHPHSELAKVFAADFQKLVEILRQHEFFGNVRAAYPELLLSENDTLFEKGDFSQPLLAATREEFITPGAKRWALLEFSDLEQRLLAENHIETQIHEDLLKWRDEYQAAQVSLDPRTRLDAPPPARSIFWSNLLLSAKKFFRGDDRKIIRWGLDLSGGKTVQIELRDQNGQKVTGEAEIKQGINELYRRVNKMGVSEVAIRQIGNCISLDFPGSQALSASELIRSSTMRFHIINEKFSSQNPSLADAVNRFLQEVWNEALVTSRKDPQSIHAIAWKHLHGAGQETSHFRSEAAEILWENGLRLADPDSSTMNNAVDETLSRVAIFRENAASKWQQQTHPLLILFNNYALEGAHLDNIRSAYDPSKGNYLSFDVQGSHLSREQVRTNPRNDLFAWTSRFSKEKVVGTPNELYTKGHGWRMAVLLNDFCISAPTLDSPLKDNAMISGSFSQREVSQLAADLKAGSLTFTPHILSEKNVSPELGKKDRIQGITATIVALLLVIAAMLLYYRFAGAVASVAVLFNLLVLWATLQNLGATLTLAGIAGVILTVGMAVDANVLVFERVKEEYALLGKLAPAIAAGYKKAFSAIVDSNVTTIIAALILLNFDAGPIKSFAVNLIIGIASSMFTALFMTRFFFTGWAQNPKNRTLKMADLIRGVHFNFLKYTKPAFVIALAVIIGGSSLIYVKRASVFGMDFTGGYALNLEVSPMGGDEALLVEQALVHAGADRRDLQIRELNPSNHLRILLSTAMEERDNPFHNLAFEEGGKNPRIKWIGDALTAEGLSIQTPSLENHWTAMSGQISDSMRNHALFGLLLSLVCIFVYLAFRFEYEFAAAALICLLHDVLITLGLIGLLHALNIPVQIDLNTIAAIMTIIGYSLNDTIIIFDRIREEIRLHRGQPLPTLVSRALNATLSRTIMTSSTTLLVLLALVFLGGASIFSFSLVMALGVFFGTLSSWFIAAPLVLFFHRRASETGGRALAHHS